MQAPSANILQDPEVIRAIRTALEEDLGTGDCTTDALVAPEERAVARVVCGESCVVAGIPVAERVFLERDATLSLERGVEDGNAGAAGQVVLTIRGLARPILEAERVALNFLQRLSGIATLTSEFVRRAKPFGVDILDTRKTTPGLRLLEKYAVRCGGGVNHRFGLFDRILIKDNHRQLWRRRGRSLAEAVRAARERYPDRIVQIEVDSESELEEVLPAGPDWVLLDNMSPDQLRRCVELVAGRCRVEASGGVRLDNVEAIARTGVDAISVGALTHSARAVDFSLEITPDG